MLKDFCESINQQSGMLTKESTVTDIEKHNKETSIMLDWF